ncbi:MAG TPA: hypothetical protein VGM10_11730 [Actinocrinis sp.]|jgi:hypothetical protein
MTMPSPGGPQFDPPGGPRATAAPAPAPSMLRNAFYLALAGAAAELVGGVLSATQTSAIKTQLVKQYPRDTTAQINQAVGPEVVALLVFSAVLAALWVYMAFKIRSGRMRAKSLGTFFLLLALLAAIADLRGGSGTTAVMTTGVGVLFGFVRCLIGLAVAILMWMRNPVRGYSVPSWPRLGSLGRSEAQQDGDPGRTGPPEQYGPADFGRSGQFGGVEPGRSMPGFPGFPAPPPSPGADEPASSRPDQSWPPNPPQK